MKVEEIRDIACNLRIDPTGLFKTDLIRQIQEREGNHCCFATSYVRVCSQLNCLWRTDCMSTVRKNEGKL